MLHNPLHKSKYRYTIYIVIVHHYTIQQIKFILIVNESTNDDETYNAIKLTPERKHNLLIVRKRKRTRHVSLCVIKHTG